jgi:hypothetical protein
MMSIPVLKSKYAHSDILDFEELRKDWILNFTKIDYEKLTMINNSIIENGLINLSLE